MTMNISLVRVVPRKAVLIVWGAAMLLAACGTQPLEAEGAAEELQAVTIVLGFTAAPNYAPAFVALEEGYFADEGLDVEITQGGSADPLILVGAGQLDFYYGSLESLPIHVEAGLPVKSLAAQTPVNTFGVMVAADSGITTPKDLEGHTVAVPATGATSRLWGPFLQLNDVDEGAIDVATVSPRAQDAALINGDVDASTGAYHSSLVRVREDMPGAGFLPFAEYGVDVAGQGLVARADYIENNPEIVQGVVNAFIRGLETSIEDPALGVEAVGAHFPEAVQAYGDPTAVLEAINEFTVLAEPLGFIDDEIWQRTIDLLVEVGDLNEPLTVSDYHTNEFVLRAHGMDS
jgi:NitT/TauT family transport system substrate-binding protein